MLFPFVEGPKERWQHNLESLTRDGLFYLAGQLFEVLKGLNWIISRDTLEGLIVESKRAGKNFAAIRRHRQYQADPDKYIDAVIRRSRAAKKAALRRKRTRRP